MTAKRKPGPPGGSDSFPRQTEKDGRLRLIPSVERILSVPDLAPLAARYGRDQLKKQVVAAIDEVRRSGEPFPSMEAFSESISERMTERSAPSLRGVVNGTGVIIHTNLGRSPLEPSLVSRAMGEVAGYSNLEFDLEQGERGSRSGHLQTVCRELFGCEAAILANNNAAGTLLVLAALAAGREVVVSRGELVEIGGGFRVPDVIQQGGARLHEVGTTNKTRAADYAAAAGKKTGALLRVHRSNFDIVGFTETPSVDELVEVARKKKLPLVYDEGSGRVVDLSRYGFSRAETISELISSGVDIVTCSTDKLIGATQGGLILGRADLVERCARHPLMRALRAGKESYALIGETLRSFLAQRHEAEIPIYRMLAASLAALQERARSIATRCRGEVIEVRSVLGGGTTPTESIASFGVRIPGDAEKIHAAMLRNVTPVVGRIDDGSFIIDVRTLLDGEENVVIEALGKLS
jgi:L-seryl-tRNA(Ser) seleniumtransferase